MDKPLTIFVGTFTTMLAVLTLWNLFQFFLKLLAGKDDRAHRQVARQARIYAAVLTFFFLVCGTLMLKLFSVPLSTARIVGGIILVRIGFSLFLPSPTAGID